MGETRLQHALLLLLIIVQSCTCCDMLHVQTKL